MNETLKKALITMAAVLGYGGWALYSNWPSDGNAEAQLIALRAGVIQGSYSGLLTLINIVLLEALFLRLNPHLPCMVNLISTLTIATTAQYAIIIPVHIINQTPNIVITLLPGFIIGTAFSAAYLLSIRYKHYPNNKAK